MSIMEAHPELGWRIAQAEPTTAAADEGLASRTPNREYRFGWETIIDQYLVEWGRDPSVLMDEDFVPPSIAIIHKACQVARGLRDDGAPPPLRVVPDGEGGISFERRAGSCFQSLNILEDGSIEILTFEDSKLVCRYSFP